METFTSFWLWNLPASLTEEMNLKPRKDWTLLVRPLRLAPPLNSSESRRNRSRVCRMLAGQVFCRKSDLKTFIFKGRQKQQESWQVTQRGKKRFLSAEFWCENTSDYCIGSSLIMWSLYYNKIFKVIYGFMFTVTLIASVFIVK